MCTIYNIHAVHTQCTHTVMHTSHICTSYIQCIYAMYSYSAHVQYTDAIHTCSAHIWCIHSTNSAYMQCTQDSKYLSVLCEWACLCKLSSETMRTLKVFPDFWHETETILGVRILRSNQLWYMP